MRYVSVAVFIHTYVSYNLLCDCWHNSQRSTKVDIFEPRMDGQATLQGIHGQTCICNELLNLLRFCSQRGQTAPNLGHFDHSILSRIFLMLYHNDWNTCFRNALQSTSKVLLATWLITWVVRRERKCFKLGNLWCDVTKFTPQIDKSGFLSVDKINRFPLTIFEDRVTKSVFENKSSPQLHCIKIWGPFGLCCTNSWQDKKNYFFCVHGPFAALISEGRVKEIWITTASSLYHCHLKHAHLWILEVFGVSQPSQWWCFYSWPVPHTLWKTKTNLK